MPKSRERHGRALRGRIAWPNPYTGAPIPLSSAELPAQFFSTCVTDALTQIEHACPRALVSVDVGIEDVPTMSNTWIQQRVPLASALTPTVTAHGQIVLYRRPLERRANSRKGLRILIYRTIVEQLASVTGLSVEELDPLGHRLDSSDDD